MLVLIAGVICWAVGFCGGYFVGALRVRSSDCQIAKQRFEEQRERVEKQLEMTRAGK